MRSTPMAFDKSRGPSARLMAVFRKVRMIFSKAIPFRWEQTYDHNSIKEGAMRSLIFTLFLAIGTLACYGLAHAEERLLVVHVVDAENNPVEGIVLSNKGDGTLSNPTNSAGITRMALPESARPSDWVHLQLRTGSRGNDKWILISPWDGRVEVPPFDNQPNHFVSVVVARKFDKGLLENPLALRAMAATANNEIGPKTLDATITEKQRRALLVEVAKIYGLGADDIDKAIRSWGEKAKDPYELGLAALYTKNYPLASEQLSKSLEIREAELETRKTEVADSAIFLGRSLNDQGEYQEAAEAYRKALNLRPGDITIINELGLVLTKAGNYSEAETYYKWALQTKVKVLGSDHPDVATTLNNLAVLYDNQGRYAEAEPLYKQALEIRKKELGPDHPDVATTLNNLAESYCNQGKYIEAEPLIKMALAIREKALGANHPDVATSLNNLGLLYESQGKYAEAEPLYMRALEIDERALGLNHPSVATDLNNLAALYESQGKYAEAEPLYKQALAIREKVLGADHPSVATSLNNLAALYKSQGKYAEAEPLYKHALAIMERALGANHPNVAVVLENYAALLRKMNRESEAAKIEARARGIRARLEQKNPKH